MHLIAMKHYCTNTNIAGLYSSETYMHCPIIQRFLIFILSLTNRKTILGLHSIKEAISKWIE